MEVTSSYARLTPTICLPGIWAHAPLHDCIVTRVSRPAGVWYVSMNFSQYTLPPVFHRTPAVGHVDIDSWSTPQGQKQLCWNGNNLLSRFWPGVMEPQTYVVAQRHQSEIVSGILSLPKLLPGLPGNPQFLKPCTHTHTHINESWLLKQCWNGVNSSST